MVKTVTSIERERVAHKGSGLGGGLPPPRNGSNGSGKGGGSNGGDDRREPSAEKARFAMWVGLASILMLFATLVSAYIFLAAGDNWLPIRMPRWLWLSTVLILASSLTLSAASKALKRGQDGEYLRRLLWTVGLGLSFLGAQVLAWRELVAQGVYQAVNQHRNFFYLLTGVHAAHLVGGVLALIYLLLRTRRKGQSEAAEKRRRGTVSVISLYWHFMDGLWVFLFLLLLLWR